jgi:hypothetical protein
MLMVVGTIFSDEDAQNRAASLRVGNEVKFGRVALASRVIVCQ